MAKLILGPTGSGKTTYINNLIEKKLIKYEDLVFGFEVKDFFFKFWKKKKKISKSSIIHYNILNSFIKLGNGEKNISLKKDKILNNILGHKNILDEIIIIVAPVEELVLRAKTRKKIEENIDAVYDNVFWAKTLKHIDLLNIYEQLFEILDNLEMKYKVVFSSLNNFKQSNKDKILKNLEGVCD